MIFTVEPMLVTGSQDWEQWDDDWTVVTRDGSRCAQFEHTIVIREDGPEILTLPPSQL
jgi:methionyl aminopeptidase